MKYRVLDFNLTAASKWCETLNAAIGKSKAMHQSYVWFIEDSNGDIVRLVHADVVYIPEEIVHDESYAKI